MQSIYIWMRGYEGILKYIDAYEDNLAFVVHDPSDFLNIV